jgi:S1-C subfamily serine protease/uncharacterized tellurite resistance protein B-like protein
MRLRGRPPETPGRGGDGHRRSEAIQVADRRARLAVWRLLHSVARSDESVTVEERSLLDRYMQALDVGPDAPTARVAADPAELLEPIPLDERAHALRMMFHVAYADGGCSDIELALLKRLAKRMGLSAVQFADIQISIERDVVERRRTRRLLWIAAAVAVVAFGGLVIWLVQRPPRSSAPMVAFVAEAKRQLVELDRRVSEVATAERPGTGDEQIRELSATLDGLLARAAELEAAHRLSTGSSRTRGGGPGEGPVERAAADASADSLAAELESIKRQLDELKSRLEFPRLLERYADSVVFIRIGFLLVSDVHETRRAYNGTGFFVSEDGLIVTNKHLVYPWLFEPEVVRLLENGYQVDFASVHFAAWTNGSRALDESRMPVLEESFHTRRGELELVTTPAEEMERRRERLADGSEYEGRFHVQGSSDLALLRARVTEPATPIPLAPDLATVEKLDPVLVLGFPTGDFILETGIAETVATRGEVLKIEESLFINASIHPGNSGGPVLDRAGRAIGVVARRFGGEGSLATCIKSPHVLTLIEQVPDLTAAADPAIERGTTPRP